MSSRVQEASEIVRKHALYSGGMGLIPIPLVDMAGIAAVQIRMTHELCKLYGVEFKEGRAKTVVTSLLGGLTAGALAAGLPGSVVKSVPIVGSMVGFLTMPAFGAGVTWGIGNALIPHFELGGTLANLDPASPETQAAYTKGLKDRAVSAP